MNQPCARGWGWLALLAALLAPEWARAQSARGSPNGIKMGDARLHPFLDLELRYNSAAGFFPVDDQPADRLSPELIGHIRPGFKLDVGSDLLALSLTANVDYVRYTGWLTPGSQTASHWEAGADLAASFAPRGPMGFELADHFSRSDRTLNPAVGVGVLSLFNEVRAAVPLRPGGGALEITPSGAFAVELFDAISDVPVANCADPSCDPARVPQMNYTNLRGGLELKWKFFPKTAVLIDASLDSRRYLDPASTNLTATLLKVMGGLAGLVTSKISVVAKVGWARDFGEAPANTLAAQLEATYLMNEASNIKLGYLRTVEPVPTFGSYRDDRGYLDARMLLGGRLTLSAAATYDLLTFYGSSGRADTVLGIELGPEVQVTSWWIVAAGYVFNRRSSNQSEAASVNFIRHEGFLRLTFTY